MTINKRMEVGKLYKRKNLGVDHYKCLAEFIDNHSRTRYVVQAVTHDKCRIPFVCENEEEAIEAIKGVRSKTYTLPDPRWDWEEVKPTPKPKEVWYVVYINEYNEVHYLGGKSNPAGTKKLYCFKLKVGAKFASVSEHLYPEGCPNETEEKDEGKSWTNI